MEVQKTGAEYSQSSSNLNMQGLKAVLQHRAQFED
jgi:hypothetical protein